MTTRRFATLVVWLGLTAAADSFLVPPPSTIHTRTTSFSTRLWSTQEDVSSMRVGELKKELESYGISTKSFLEKKELVEALTEAREKGLTPKKEDAKTSSSTPSSSSSTTTTPSPSPSSSSSSSSKSRDERLEEEMIKCNAMKASELKKELQDKGISTTSFFEKSEFVKAAAEARVDGVTTKKASSNNSEGYAEYKNVEVLTDDAAGPRAKGQSQQTQAQGNPFGGGGGGASPFGGMGGMADMFGGGAGGAGGMADMMGGMGGIGDMLKNMGGMGGGAPGGGGGASNPFAGVGGMGDAMGKAQSMMKNPKVMEIMAKAQSNPKIMKAMQECMANPAAFSKYQSDPEVGEIMRELQKYM